MKKSSEGSCTSLDFLFWAKSRTALPPCGSPLAPLARKNNAKKGPAQATRSPESTTVDTMEKRFLIFPQRERQVLKINQILRNHLPIL